MNNLAYKVILAIALSLVIASVGVAYYVGYEEAVPQPTTVPTVSLAPTPLPTVAAPRPETSPVASATVLPTPAPLPSGRPACTEEAKQCPDGSYVGRGGPNCEFPPCPGN